MNKNHGTFLAHDVENNPLILEWETITGKPEKVSHLIKSLTPIFIPTYTKMEVGHAYQKPELIPHDFMLQSLAPLLESGVGTVDWKNFEEKTKNLLEQFFAKTDWAAHTQETDIHIFIVAHDKKSNKKIGAIQFLITSDFEKNTVKTALFGIVPSFHNKGIEELLMCSIFKIKPKTERIFLHTRVSNYDAINQYESWGFSEFKSDIPHWINLEYLSKQTRFLQEKADDIKISHT